MVEAGGSAVTGNVTNIARHALCMLHSAGWMEDNAAMSWYAMNQAMADLHLAANRELFAAHPDEYLDRYELTADEHDAIRDKDVLKLWDLRAQPYILRGFQRRTGITDQAFNDALKDRTFGA